MAGHSIDDACTAQRATAGKPPKTEQSLSLPSITSASAKVATSNFVQGNTSSVTNPGSVIIGGVTYYPGTITQPSAAHVALSQTAHIETLSTYSDEDDNPYSFHSYLALEGPLTTSVDWSTHKQDTALLDVTPSPVLSHSAHALIVHPVDCPFILASGASNHISSKRSDFKTLCPIEPHPIHGFNGSTTSALGI